MTLYKARQDCSLLLLIPMVSAASGDPVRVVKNSAGWQLLVDWQEDFFIKGVGCNEARGEKVENYL